MKNINPILIDLPIPIETPRLMLRPPKIGDGAMLNAAVLESFDLLNKFMLWANDKPSLEESEEIVRREAANWIFKKKDDPELMLLILDKKTHDFIGATGYWIRKKYSGQGLITEATNALTQYAFKALNVKRITITCDIDNEQSKKIPERLGYQLESIMRLNRIKPVTNVITDTLVYVRFGLDDLPELEVTW